jgi:hypothetical protein
VVKKFLNKYSATAVEHLHLSRTYHRQNVSVLPQVKNIVKGHQFASAKEVTVKETRALIHILKNGSTLKEKLCK